MGLPERKDVRIPGFDYGTSGAYFVTLCTRDSLALFGTRAQRSPIGELVASYWSEIPAHFPEYAVDEWILMPNHLHGILIIDPERGGHGHPLHVVISQFKAAVTRGVGQPIWQRNYYEHVIRTQRSLNRIRRYILTNPDFSTPR